MFWVLEPQIHSDRGCKDKWNFRFLRHIGGKIVTSFHLERRDFKKPAESSSWDGFVWITMGSNLPCSLESFYFFQKNCYQEGKRECKWPCGWFSQWRMPWASWLCLNCEVSPPLREQEVIAKTELKQARARKGQEMSLRLLSHLPPMESLASLLKRMDNETVLWISVESYFG